MIELSELTAQARRATEELLEAAHLETGDIFVVGCSSSEIRGGRIGSRCWSSRQKVRLPDRGRHPPAPRGRQLGHQLLAHL